jgi:putative ABC transport system substrate-binding protein
MFDKGRRDFISLIGGAAASPLAARAQQSAVPVIGFLGSASPGPFAQFLSAFKLGLMEAGYVEGTNVLIEYRWAEDQYDQLPTLAADLIRRRVVMVVAGGNAAVLAAKVATTTIPILFTTGSDPVQLGFVASLARPGGNMTGATVLAAELGPKRLELLHELVPTADVVGLLVNPTNPTIAEPTTREVQAAARTLGLQIQVLHASTETGFDAVFATLVQLRAGGLVIGGDNLFNGRSERLGALALRNAIPTIYQFHDFAAAGGLISYGGSLAAAYRQVGIYAARILKGEKPADLPVQQSSRVELIINLKTAKALGLTVPLSLLGRADEVIE